MKYVNTRNQLNETLLFDIELVNYPKREFQLLNRSNIVSTISHKLFKINVISGI